MLFVCAFLSSCAAFRKLHLRLPIQLWFSQSEMPYGIVLFSSAFPHNRRRCAGVSKDIMHPTETSALSKSTLCVWVLIEQCRYNGCSSIALNCAYTSDDKVWTTQHACQSLTKINKHPSASVKICHHRYSEVLTLYSYCTSYPTWICLASQLPGKFRLLGVPYHLVGWADTLYVELQTSLLVRIPRPLLHVICLLSLHYPIT